MLRAGFSVEIQRLLQIVKGERAGSHKGIVLVCDADIVNADRGAVLALAGFGCQGVASLYGPHEIVLCIQRDCLFPVGSHGRACDIIRHGKIYAAVSKAQRVQVFLRDGHHRFCIAGGQLGEDNAQPLAEAVAAVAVFQNFLKIHRTSSLQNVVKLALFYAVCRKSANRIHNVFVKKSVCIL